MKQDMTDIESVQFECSKGHKDIKLANVNFWSSNDDWRSFSLCCNECIKDFLEKHSIFQFIEENK